MLSEFGIVDYGAFLIGTLLVILLPGFSSRYVLITAARSKVRAAFVLPTSRC